MFFICLAPSSSRQLAFPSSQLYGEASLLEHPAMTSSTYLPSPDPNVPTCNYEMSVAAQRALLRDEEDDSCPLTQQVLLAQDDSCPLNYVNKAGKRKMLLSPSKDKKARKEPLTLEVFI